MIVWDLQAPESAAPLSLIQPDDIHGVAWMSDSWRIVTACGDGRVQMWDATTGKALQATGHFLRDDGARWIIQAWQPIQRTWENPPCPCLHADPQFPDCPPGESRTVHGGVSFYQGTGIQAELKRLGEIWKPRGNSAK